MKRRLAAAGLVVVVLGLGAVPAAANPPTLLLGCTAALSEDVCKGRAVSIQCAAERPQGPKPYCAASIVVQDGHVWKLFWEHESHQNITHGIAQEFGNVAVNDESRRLVLGPDGPSWTIPEVEAEADRRGVEVSISTKEPPGPRPR